MIEQTILTNLVLNETYARKVLPFIKETYFTEYATKHAFKHINEFILKYNKCPSQDALIIAVENDKSISEDAYSDVVHCIRNITKKEENQEWLIDETEKYCRERAVYNAIVDSIAILDGRDKEKSKDGIPLLLQNALGVTFDTHVGHDYFEDALARLEFYNNIEQKIPFDLEYLNRITNGGVPRKTLNMLLAGTAVGKSLALCHFTTGFLKSGFNVLYITLEMAEERIAERIDANMMNVSIGELKDIPAQMFQDRIQKITNKTNGKLIIKEYPTSTAHAGHFRALLTELKMKRNFVPDVICIDYLNLCLSSRYKPSASLNSYTVIKAIAEELRGLAVEHKVAIFSATQTTRSGFSNTDVELTDTSESFGLPATADLMFALINTEDLEKMNQLMVKQLKNRYNSSSTNKRFLIGIDREKMKLYDLEPAAQKGIQDTGEEEKQFSTSTRKRDFGSFKI
jgi:archaellum biogenesis ATPase FlaH